MWKNFDDTVGAVVERPTPAQRVTGSIPSRNKYLYGLQSVVPGLTVCVCDFFMFVKRTNDTGIIPRTENLRKFAIEAPIYSNVFGKNNFNTLT